MPSHLVEFIQSYKWVDCEFYLFVFISLFGNILPSSQPNEAETSAIAASGLEQHLGVYEALLGDNRV